MSYASYITRSRLNFKKKRGTRLDLMNVRLDLMNVRKIPD
jgi:hypothetical protein